MRDAPGSMRIILFPFDRAHTDPETVTITKMLFGCLPLRRKVDRLTFEVQAENRVSRWEDRGYVAHYYFRDTLGDLAAVTGGVIYIVGHCEAGVSTLSASDTTLFGNSEVTATVDEIVGLLDGANLPTAFAGTFKVFGCKSALASHDGRSAAFAADFAQEAKKNWPRCTVLGYTDEIGLAKRDGNKTVDRVSFDRFGRATPVSRT